MTHAVLVAGAGSIARRHVGNLLALDPATQVTVLRRAPGPEDDGWRAAGIGVAYGLAEVDLQAITAAIVASPAPTHVGLASTLAAAGIPMLVEKPISHTLDGVGELVDECRRRGIVLMVGYNLRFRASLRRLRSEVVAGTIGDVELVRADVGQYLPDWRPTRDYRSTVTAQRRLGGGALLELSHEIDYLRWLFGEVAEVRAWTGRRGDLEIDVEDTAELILQFEAPITASVHLDLLRRVPSRTCRVDGTRGSLVWDAMASRLQLLEPGGGMRELYAGVDEADSAYRDELAHFLECVAGRATPLVDGHDALQTLRVVQAASRAAAIEGVRP